MKHKWKTHMWWHRFSGAVILFTTLYYGGKAVYKMGIPDYEDRIHSPMGFAVLCVIWVIVLGGMITKSRLNRATSEMAKVHKIKAMHK